MFEKSYMSFDHKFALNEQLNLVRSVICDGSLWTELCNTPIWSLVLPYTPYWILSTDYENSALVYSCTDVLRLFHVDFAWILGRTRSLPVATITKAKDVFNNNNIDVSRMIMSKQAGCEKDY